MDCNKNMINLKQICLKWQINQNKINNKARLFKKIKVLNKK